MARKIKPTLQLGRPAGVPESKLRADHAACVDESGIARLREDQITLEQRCMMAYGYKVIEKR